MHRLQIDPGPLCRAQLLAKDLVHIKRAQASSLAIAKQRRKVKHAAEKAAEEDHIVKGVTYAPGGF